MSARLLEARVILDRTIDTAEKQGPVPSILEARRSCATFLLRERYIYKGKGNRSLGGWEWLGMC